MYADTLLKIVIFISHKMKAYGWIIAWNAEDLCTKAVCARLSKLWSFCNRKWRMVFSKPDGVSVCVCVCVCMQNSDDQTSTSTYICKFQLSSQTIFHLILNIYLCVQCQHGAQRPLHMTYSQAWIYLHVKGSIKITNPLPSENTFDKWLCSYMCCGCYCYCYYYYSLCVHILRACVCVCSCLGDTSSLCGISMPFQYCCWQYCRCCWLDSGGGGGGDGGSSKAGAVVHIFFCS